ncbi:hypothetical protein D3C86_1888660 [compost metagenome]
MYFGRLYENSIDPENKNHQPAKPLAIQTPRQYLAELLQYCVQLPVYVPLCLRFAKNQIYTNAPDWPDLEKYWN